MGGQGQAQEGRRNVTTVTSASQAILVSKSVQPIVMHDMQTQCTTVFSMLFKIGV